MTAFRTMALTLALGLLVACDEPPKPPAPVPAPPKIESTTPPAAPAEPIEPPSVATSATPAPSVKLEPQPAPAVENRAAPPDKAPAAAQRVPRPQEKPLAKIKSKPAPLPPVKLDLRLPDELVQSLEPGEPLEKHSEHEPLLPPLFVEKPAEPSPYQLNGRLITNDQVDDYWESVEGAELQIEFRN